MFLMNATTLQTKIYDQKILNRWVSVSGAIIFIFLSFIFFFMNKNKYFRAIIVLSIFISVLKIFLVIFTDFFDFLFVRLIDLSFIFIFLFSKAFFKIQFLEKDFDYILYILFFVFSFERILSLWFFFNLKDKEIIFQISNDQLLNKIKDSSFDSIGETINTELETEKNNINNLLNSEIVGIENEVKISSSLAPGGQDFGQSTFYYLDQLFLPIIGETQTNSFNFFQNTLILGISPIEETISKTLASQYSELGTLASSFSDSFSNPSSVLYSAPLNLLKLGVQNSSSSIFNSFNSLSSQLISLKTLQEGDVLVDQTIENSIIPNGVIYEALGKTSPLNSAVIEIIESSLEKENTAIETEIKNFLLNNEFIPNIGSFFEKCIEDSSQELWDSFYNLFKQHPPIAVIEKILATSINSKYTDITNSVQSTLANAIYNGSSSMENALIFNVLEYILSDFFSNSGLTLGDKNLWIASQIIEFKTKNITLKEYFLRLFLFSLSPTPSSIQGVDWTTYLLGKRANHASLFEGVNDQKGTIQIILENGLESDETTIQQLSILEQENVLSKEVSLLEISQSFISNNFILEVGIESQNYFNTNPLSSFKESFLLPLSFSLLKDISNIDYLKNSIILNPSTYSDSPVQWNFAPINFTPFDPTAIEVQINNYFGTNLINNDSLNISNALQSLFSYELCSLPVPLEKSISIFFFSCFFIKTTPIDSEMQVRMETELTNSFNTFKSGHDLSHKLEKQRSFLDLLINSLIYEKEMSFSSSCGSYNLIGSSVSPTTTTVNIVSTNKDFSITGLSVIDGIQKNSLNIISVENPFSLTFLNNSMSFNKGIEGITTDSTSPTEFNTNLKKNIKASIKATSLTETGREYLIQGFLSQDNWNFFLVSSDDFLLFIFPDGSFISISNKGFFVGRKNGFCYNYKPIPFIVGYLIQDSSYKYQDIQTLKKEVVGKCLENTLIQINSKNSVTWEENDGLNFFILENGNKILQFSFNQVLGDFSGLEISKLTVN